METQEMENNQISDQNSIAICSLCQMTFPSHEEICVHTCEEIKEEKIKDIIEHSEVIANDQLDISDQDDLENESSFSCLELSEEFLVSILKQVDDLCENIKTGDSDIVRTFEINKNLNNAVIYYRSKLDQKKCALIDSDQNGDIGIESDDWNEEKCILNDIKPLDECQKKLKSSSMKIKRTGSIEDVSDEKENLKKFKVPKHKSKKERQAYKFTNEKIELVKNQCGRHSLLEMAGMLNVSKSSLSKNIRMKGIIIEKKQIEYFWECRFCEMGKNSAKFENDDLFPLLRFNQDEEKFQCFLCNSLLSERSKLLTHLKTVHRNEIDEKTIMNNKSEQNQDCDGSVCKKIYGVHGKAKELWCKECLKELKLAKQMKKESNAGVCPECGILANNLNAHRNDMHLAEKQICSLCSLEFRNVQRLYKHKRMVHDDKVPCTECGKLIGVNRIKDHMKLSHTPNDQKRYRCDTCGKGFMETQKLSDHINVHTGEKPYKCKFCSSCFASNGTHALHERSHLKKMKEKIKIV